MQMCHKMCSNGSFGNENVREIPSSELLHNPEDIWMEFVEQRKDILHKVCMVVVEKFVQLQLNITSVPQSI